MRRKKISLRSHPKRVIRTNRDGINEDVTGLICAYIFLLASCILLVEVFDNFKVDLIDINTTYKVVFLPFIFFLVNVITKKFGFRIATISIVVSTIASFLFSSCLNVILLSKVNIFLTIGDVVGFMVAMFINLSIYYYLLINTKMSFFPILLTYIFSLLINNLTSMLFKYNMIYSTYFWQEYVLLILVQFILILPLTVIDREIKRGI